MIFLTENCNNQCDQIIINLTVYQTLEGNGTAAVNLF